MHACVRKGGELRACIKKTFGGPSARGSVLTDRHSRVSESAVERLHPIGPSVPKIRLRGKVTKDETCGYKSFRTCKAVHAYSIVFLSNLSRSLININRNRRLFGGEIAHNGDTRQ